MFIYIVPTRCSDVHYVVTYCLTRASTRKIHGPSSMITNSACRHDLREIFDRWAVEQRLCRIYAPSGPRAKKNQKKERNRKKGGGGRKKREPSNVLAWIVDHGPDSHVAPGQGPCEGSTPALPLTVGSFELGPRSLVFQRSTEGVHGEIPIVVRSRFPMKSTS